MSSPWSRECNSRCLINFSSEELRSRFAKWGGNARFVLKTDSHATLDGTLESYLNSADLWLTLKAAANSKLDISKLEKVPHMLVMLASKAPFSVESCMLVFASDYIREMCLDNLDKKGSQWLAEIFSAPSDSWDLTPGSVRGHLFERFALSSMFRSGHMLQRVPISADAKKGKKGGSSGKNSSSGKSSSSGSSTVASTAVSASGPERSFFYFQTISEVAAKWKEKPTAVALPHSSDWPTWDAVSLEAGKLNFWQVTTSLPAEHALKADGFREAERLRKKFPADASFGWVLPESLVEAAAAGKAPRVTEPAWAAAMSQFVVDIELGATSKTSGKKRRRPESAAAGGAGSNKSR
jgi:hypothetical protein